MPQLDTIYTMMIYLWTWLMLYLITQKTKTLQMTTNPQKYLTHNKPTHTPSWP